MLDKTYDAAGVEPEIRAAWEAADAFRAGAGAGPGAPTFCIVIPPPNVTGSLHMGHALNNTLQDILVRVERMRGKDVLWQPGVDHAGIATQMVVERQLMERQVPGRRALGREAFLKKVWEWKSESGGMIVSQLKRLGCSCDWSRERFTLDEGLSRAVTRVFVQLFREGLIYRDKRLVNWDPALVTAISDLEVQQIELDGQLWHFRYPIETEPHRFISVATTRPETMLGDTAVAVHPADERYQDLVGKFVVLPLVGRRIPIVADEYADPEAGSGAVKITPAHDFNDFEVGRRHALPLVSIFDEEANLRLRDNDDFVRDVPPSAELRTTVAELDGLDRFTARASVVAMLQDRELIEKIEQHRHSVPHGDRSGVPIEPYLTDQWYVNAKALATPAIASVKAERTAFVPRNWEKTYFDWMENIQPWCISRQLWWGHRIPAWYGPDGEIFVAESEGEAEAAALRHYGSRQALAQDEDVLDTWFSSALWPFSTLGWPDTTPELQRYYPTTVLVTAFDIIFFWVARMMMMGLHFMGKEPFHKVYIHGIVRDEKGAKMSKSKGNVVDPLDLIDEFGADALRLTMASLATPGRDVKPSRARIEGHRNFGTKIWNAARFCEMNSCPVHADFDAGGELHEIANRWILTRLSDTVDALDEALADYRFSDAAETVYRFVWGSYCDWYIELAKPALAEADGDARDETRAVAGHVLAVLLKLLHPFMPYITEKLWKELGAAPGAVLALSRWPAASFRDTAALEEIDWLIDLIGTIRSVRSEMSVPPAARTGLVVVGGAGASTVERLRTHRAVIERLARIDSIGEVAAAPHGAAQLVVAGTAFALPLAGIIDFAAEKARLEKEIARVNGEIARIDRKLANHDFVRRAPEEVVEAEREKRATFAADGEKLAEALRRVQEAA